MGNRKFLLFLARIHEKKGIDLLLQAIARNLRDYQEHAFVIAGPGEAAYVSQLKTLASQLGLEKHVIWSGPLYGAAKWAVLTEAEAYILPSHQENFGISVVESLSCRVPVLITDKVNIWREIAAERAGLVGSDDVSGVCTLLERWSRISPEQRRSMRAAARECFLSKFDVASTSGTLFNLLAAGSRIDHHNEVLQCAS